MSQMFDMGAGDDAEEVLVEGVPPDSYLERFQVRQLSVLSRLRSQILPLWTDSDPAVCAAVRYIKHLCHATICLPARATI